MSRQTNDEAAPAIDRAFLSFIEAHKGGDAISEISKAMRQAAAATQLTGKASAVDFQIKIQPATKGSAATLVIVTKTKTKLPEIEQPGSIFYADDDFNLVREDPKQIKLPLREVGAPAAMQAQPLREAGKA